MGAVFSLTSSLISFGWLESCEIMANKVAISMLTTAVTAKIVATMFMLHTSEK
jgi:hypothetical protein